jgi:tRNA modification GTPase
VIQGLLSMVATRTPLPDADDTIVALASAVGPGLRAVVRLSGRQAAAIASTLFPTFIRNPGRHLVVGDLHLLGLRVPLPADLYWFPGPSSYTGQDVVELHTLSCPPLIEKLIAACLDAGARAARPGEFTLRAFLAGKLDLTRAEAVLGVIDAAGEGELKHALAQLAGGLAHPLEQLRDDLLNLLADVEAGLDFADEDITFVQADALLGRLAKGLAHLTLLKRQIELRGLSDRPFRVVLAGRPNAGKSSLFNALVGRAAAIVSAEPGTTRDYLEKDVRLRDVTLRLVDTAGLRPAADSVESAAQSLGRDQARQADLVLLCLEGGIDTEAAPEAEDVLRIATKCDLLPSPGDLLATSAETREGLDELRTLLAERARRRGTSSLAPSLSRCRHHVDACLAHLRQAHAIVRNEEPPELLALELRLTLEELGAMVGAVYTDDLLDRVFSRFCIGK